MKKVLVTASLSFGIILLGACSDEEKLTLPVHQDMELESKQEIEKVDPNLPNETYIVEEGDYATFLEEYSKQYTEKGWEVVLDSKPDFMIFEKDNKQVKVMPVETDEGIKVFLYEEEKAAVDTPGK